MTALKPTEQVWGIRGVASERYPTNRHCAHPSCDKLSESVHHCFPRSMTKSDSYFVAIEGQVIPHAVGLCGSGTTGHHGDVEEHRAWIKLEDGVFVWYERLNADQLDPRLGLHDDSQWKRLGPLNPQPGSRDPQRKRTPAVGRARRQREMIGIRVPRTEQEDGAGMLEDLWLQVEQLIGHDPPRPIYYTIIDSFNWVLLNEP